MVVSFPFQVIPASEHGGSEAGNHLKVLTIYGTLPNSRGEHIEGESLTSFFDDAGAQAIDSILKEKRLHNENSALTKLIHFVSLQVVRIPQQRNLFSQVKDSIISKWGPEVVFESQNKPLGEYTEADMAFGFVASLDVARDLIPYLDNKMIFLTEAPSALRFIISDNPVVLHNHKDYGRRSGLGLGKPGIHAFMPISPKYCLEFVCPEVSLSYFNNPIGRKIMDRQRQGLPCICDDDRVSFVNELQVIQSERWLYAQKKEDFTLPIKILQQSPRHPRP